MSSTYLPGMDRPYFIGIAGGSASGKSTLAKKIRELLGENRAAIIHVDSYYQINDHLNMDERAKLNYDHPARLDFDLLEEHLQQLREGHEVHIPVYDYATHNRSKETMLVRPLPYIIIEGILTLHPEALRNLLDFTVFVDTDEALRLQRRMQRDVIERGRTPECIQRQWSETVEAMYREFCLPTIAFADMTLHGDEVTMEKAQSVIDQTPSSA